VRGLGLAKGLSLLKARPLAGAAAPAWLDEEGDLAQLVAARRIKAM
jgi:hypothetical protein